MLTYTFDRWLCRACIKKQHMNCHSHHFGIENPHKQQKHETNQKHQNTKTRFFTFAQENNNNHNFVAEKRTGTPKNIPKPVPSELTRLQPAGQGTDPELKKRN